MTFTTPKDYREVGEGPPPFTPSTSDAANQMDFAQNIKETTRKVAYGGKFNFRSSAFLLLAWVNSFTPMRAIEMHVYGSQFLL